jgi:hypothetical protein
LGTTSIVTAITYAPRAIEYQTFDASASDVIKLTFAPQRVLSGGIELPALESEAHSGWIWDEAASTLRVQHDHSSVSISG